jgi:hypothetical protein
MSYLECWEALLGPARQIHMDRGTHSGTKIGGAAVEVSILLTQHEVLARLSFDRVLHSLDTSGEPLEDSLHISTLLHGDDSQLILLVNPNLGEQNKIFLSRYQVSKSYQEAFLLVVKDSSALGPVSLHASCL